MINVEKWTSYEISFLANVQVNDAFEAEVDVIFTHESGEKIIMPAFWDGGFDWRVRFAPTELGKWAYVVKENEGVKLDIDGINGEINCIEYIGEYEIYKRGFIKAAKGKKYFTYADGTPFFYLGDTHWMMLKEEFDSAGPDAKNIKTDSHFKYIVDRRAAQGFTVYQSEPIGAAYDIGNGIISAEDISGFRTIDRYFEYIAQKDLVHANPELGFPSLATNEGFRNNVEKLTRYWVARYASYPVMWTLGQEVDHGTNFKEPELVPTYRRMMSEIYRCDPYHSPLAAHQLNAYTITAKGGVAVAMVDYGSYVYDVNATERKKYTIQSKYSDVEGFSWWANQWRPTVDRQYNFDIPKDYWYNGNDLPIVDYEARYHIFSGGDFDARAQAWIAYLCGQGHGYGCSGMWAYTSRYSLGEDAFDGIEVIPAKVREETTWADLIDAPIAKELKYIRDFMEKINWYNLTPDFDEGNAYKKYEDKECFYASAYNGNDVYVVYFYNRTTETAGKLVNMDKNAIYVAQWFDPRTGEYTTIDGNLKVNEFGEYDIPQKPVADDMVLLVTKK